MHPMVNIALRAARKAGDTIERAMENLDQLDVQNKSANDFVTEIDKAAEDNIIYVLKKAYPDHAFISEEMGTLGDPDSAEYTWVIDPLDGTTNFIRGIPQFAVSIAAMKDGRIEHGVIYDPIKREEFTASRGAGAQVNGRRMRVRAGYEKDSALFCTGIPFGERSEEDMDKYVQVLKSLALGSAGIRRPGAAALDLAYVAAGRYDAFWEMGLKPWDMAAGLLMIQEAGGLISDFNGGHDMLKSGNLVCGSPRAFKATLQIVKPIMGDQE